MKDLPPNIEIVFAEFILNSERWLCGAYYRPPSDDTSIGLLDDALNKLNLDRYSGFILMGDFNINWSSDNSSLLATTLHDLANAYCFEILVNETTRSSSDLSSNTTIDLIFTSRPDRVCDVKVEPGLSTSDHYLVSFRIRGSPGKLPRRVREIFQYHKTDLVHFQTLLAAVPWRVIDYNDINDAWDTFSDFFLNCVRECVPVRKGSKRAKPWITEELHRLILEKRRLFKRARVSGTETAWKQFKLVRNKVRNLSKRAYSDFVTDLFKKRDNQKTFWSFVKSKRKSSQSTDSYFINGENISDPSRIAYEFNSLFASFFSGSTDQDRVTSPTLEFPPLERFSITSTQVSSEIRNLSAHKAYGPDGISAHMLKLAAPAIVPVLTLFYNHTLASGCLPSAWKRANVVPVFKQGEKSNLINYRPVSLTPIICKLLEKILCRQILDHCQNNGLVADQQHGFIPGRSCSTALVSASSQWLQSLDARVPAVDVISLDFSRAVDTI